MDAIGDTQLAVRAYLDEPLPDAKADGWSYLVVYGILQVLYVQQDAANTLAKSLALDFNLPEELRAVRKTRNAAIGHPTNPHDGGATGISRMSLTPDGFQMLVNKANSGTGFQNVSVRAAVERQTELMGDLLDRTAEQLVENEREHRRQFRDRPLHATLSSASGYMLEKVAGGLRDPASRSVALAAIKSIRGALDKFEAEIAKRGLTEPYKDSVGGTVSEIRFVQDRIKGRLDGGLTEWTDIDADVYYFFLCAKVEELQVLAQDIDQEYDSDEV